MFYGTAFMYNHAILCIFSPILEVELNIIIIIIIIIHKIAFVCLMAAILSRGNELIYQPQVTPQPRGVVTWLFNIRII